MDRLYPSVTCLCVTRGKPEMLKRAVKCFRDQQYPNKQLVVVYKVDDTSTWKLLESKILPGVAFLRDG